MDSTRARTVPTALMIALMACPGLLPAASLLAGGGGAEPAAATAPAPDAYRQELESWWAQVEASLRNPDGWLTLIGRHWLQEGENRFGSAADNEIVLPAGRAPARAGVLRLAGGKVTLEAAPGAAIVYDGKPVTTTLELVASPLIRPMFVELGSLRLHLVERGGRLGLRVRDREHPALAAFTGIKRFPVDPAWRVEARFEPYDPPKQIKVANGLGEVTEGPSYGAVVFERKGRTWRLDALDGQSGTELFLIFGDGTNAEETYGGGRYLETERESGGKVVVDFNRAYSPSCAHTPFATCALPPRQNKLELRVTAGEKRYGEDDHAAVAAQAAPPPAAVPPAPANAAAAPVEPRADFEAWRQEREKGLRNPDGWLTLVGLHWLEEGENPIGSGEENHIVFPAGRAPARAGVLRLADGQVTLEAPAEAGITVEGKPVTTLALVSDKEGKPTILELGSLRFHVIDRGGRLGLRVRDRESPVLAAFPGVESYPFDPSWRVEARLERYDPPKKVPVPNILGTVDDEDSPAAVVFERDGRAYRLDGLEGGDQGELFLIFGDGTNGEETYGGGRFLITEAPAGGTVVVDFNRAYNPPCAFTPYATCPLPPRQNKLAVAVAAGEKNFGKGHH